MTTVTATDADQLPQTLTFSLAGGADQTRFTINSMTGELSFVTAPDFENPTDSDTNNTYEVEVTATANGETDIQTITVTVDDVTNDPTITSDGTAPGCSGLGAPAW